MEATESGGVLLNIGDIEGATTNGVIEARLSKSYYGQNTGQDGKQNPYTYIANPFNHSCLFL
jgi:hypothetical protein